MPLVFVRLLAIVSVALYLVPTGAHLFELAGKMALSPADYMLVQGLYRDWALFGIVIFAALLLTLLHAILRREERIILFLSFSSFFCLVATQVIFWVFTYPMNVASGNWTVTPEHFEMARRQWEYSHAASAVLTFLALIAITSSAVIDQYLIKVGRHGARSPVVIPAKAGTQSGFPLSRK
jgi:hypothetical protein